MKSLKLRIFTILSLFAMSLILTPAHAQKVNRAGEPVKTVVKTQRVKSVKKLSSKYVPVKYNGSVLYTFGGKYYRLANSKYVMVTPPVGLKVTALPTSRVQFAFKSAVYFCAAGAIYREVSRGNYEVVEPQVGMIVPELPEVNVSEVFINGKIYFEFDNILYKQIPTQTGVQYEVVGSISGLSL